jgi:DNA-binding transcriptional LysR family regulator
MLKRSHVRQFLALAESRSFTEAARRLRLTQPTLSAGIANLEARVGARLFERDRRGVRLTESGGAFLVIARDLENRFREADSFAREVVSPRQALRLGTIRTVSNAMLQSVVGALASSFDISLAEGSDPELRAALKGRRLDVVLTVLRQIETGHATWLAFEEPYTMLARADHRLAGRVDVPPADLAGETMIARRACEALSDTSRFFTRHGVRPKFAFKSDNDERCLAMTAAGLGITTAPASLARPGILPIGVAGYDLRRRVGILIASEFDGLEQILEVLNAIEPAVSKSGGTAFEVSQL